MKHGMTNEEVKAKAIELIAANCFYEGDISDDQDLFLDLDYESLAFSALVIELEEAFLISITKEDIEKGMNTPKKIVDFILRKMNV